MGPTLGVRVTTETSLLFKIASSTGVWNLAETRAHLPYFADTNGQGTDSRIDIGTGKDGVDMGALPPVDVPAITFIRGDANGDRTIDIADAVTIILYLFSKGVTPICLDALDADDTLSIEITDAIYVLSLLFLGGPAPPAPVPDPGMDPTTCDPLGCAGGES